MDHNDLKFYLNWLKDQLRQPVSIILFRPNGISHSYQLDQSISILRVVGCYFFFNFNRTICKQALETLIRHHILWYLIWSCTLNICPTKRTLGLYSLNKNEMLNNAPIILASL